MQRSKYSKEFRDSTVQLILNNNESVVEVALDLDIKSQTLYNWISRYKKAHNIPFQSISHCNDKI
jgi:transposase